MKNFSVVKVKCWCNANLTSETQKLHGYSDILRFYEFPLFHVLDLDCCLLYVHVWLLLNQVTLIFSEPILNILKCMSVSR